MFKRAIILIFIFLLSSNQVKAIDNDFNNWSKVNFRYRFHKKYSYLLHFQNRLRANWSEEESHLLRSALGYHFNEYLFLDLGYDWSSRYPNGFSVEHRLWQALNFEKKLSYKLTGYGWLRIEERFLDGTDYVSLRGRIRTGVNYPLNKKGDWSLDLFNEFFWNFYTVNNGPEAGMDQDWIYAGIQKVFNEHVNLQVGYLMAYFNRDEDRIQHAIRSTLNFNF